MQSLFSKRMLTAAQVAELLGQTMLTAAEAAEFLGVTVGTLEVWRSTGRCLST